MKASYGRFAVILTISLILMYLLSMSQVRQIDHFHLNLSNLWTQAVASSMRAHAVPSAATESSWNSVVELVDPNALDSAS